MTRIHIEMNFDTWLRCQGARDDTVGYLARGAQEDPLFPSSSNLREYLDYLTSRGVLSWVSGMFDDAWEEYVSLRFTAEVFLTRTTYSMWSVSFDNSNGVISEASDLERASKEIGDAIAAIGGKTIPRVYGFDPGEVFTFPNYVSSTSDYASICVDIEFSEYPPGVDMEIARAMADAVSMSTQFSAAFDESDVLNSQNIRPDDEDDEAA